MFRKNTLLKSGILAAIGALIAIIFTTISGIDYRNREMAGLAPEYTAPWILIGTYIGLIIFMIGVICMAVIGVLHLVKSSRNKKP